MLEPRGFAVNCRVGLHRRRGTDDVATVL
jgi:hypothetical protein